MRNTLFLAAILALLSGALMVAPPVQAAPAATAQTAAVNDPCAQVDTEVEISESSPAEVVLCNGQYLMVNGDMGSEVSYSSSAYFAVSPQTARCTWSAGHRYCTLPARSSFPSSGAYNDRVTAAVARVTARIYPVAAANGQSSFTHNVRVRVSNTPIT